MLTPSTAAISWAVPSTARRWDARNHRQLLVQRLARVGSDEGFELTINRPDAVALVDASGWVVTEQTGMRGAARAITSRAGATGLRSPRRRDRPQSLPAGLRS